MSALKSRARQDLVQEIEDALGAVDFGSIEIYVQDRTVTQITVRNIKKTSINITKPQEEQEEQNGSQKLFTIHTHYRRTE